jgi:glutamate dehydrogenase/leucine dehydrogenase
LPSALENAITMKNVGKVKAKIIAELANGPTTPERDRCWKMKGVSRSGHLANAGGVTVSYYEWVQDQYSFFWSERQINETLETDDPNAFNSCTRLRALQHRHANRGLHPGGRTSGGSNSVRGIFP